MQFEDICDKEKYFIQPYIEGETLKIHIYERQSVINIRVENSLKKKIKIDTRIKKELKKSYQTSKFYSYPIILKGKLSKDKKNKTFLILFDIFLKDEYEGKTQSKKYELRYENLILRFLNKNVTSLKSVFSHLYNDLIVKLIIEQFIETDSIDSLMFVKNIPLNYEENDYIKYDLWTNFSGTIIGHEVGESSKKTFDENQNLISEEPFEYLKSLKIFSDELQEAIIVELKNFPESEKVLMLENIMNILNKKCIFKRYNLLDFSGYIFKEIV